MCLHNCIYFMVFSIAKFNEVYFVKRNLSLLKKIALQKRHSLSAPEEEGTRALPHRIGRSRLNHQTLLRFSFTNTNHSQDPVQRQRSIFKRKGPVGKVGVLDGLIVHHAKRINLPLLKFPRMSFAQLCGTKSYFIARNLNSFRIVHYQIFDVQTSILLHVHGFFQIFFESSKEGKCMSPMACTVSSKFNLITC